MAECGWQVALGVISEMNGRYYLLLLLVRRYMFTFQAGDNTTLDGRRAGDAGEVEGGMLCALSACAAGVGVNCRYL